MTDKLNDFFYGKKVLILGFGMEGKSTLELIKNMNCEIGISDKNLVKTDNIAQYKLYSGENYLDAVDKYDIVMKSPGVIVLDLLSDEQKAKITSQTDLLLRFSENTIIGITGTKGKSTTSALTCHVLNACGKEAVLIGNIGVPPLERINDFTEDTIIVCEMSCHQLEYVKASPNIAVLLNIYEEHLDHYVNFTAYAAAKENIYKYQNEDDCLIYNTECINDKLKNAKAEKFSVSYTDKADIYIDNENFIVCGITIPIKSIKTSLLGKHNLYNIGIALMAAAEAGADIYESVESLPEFHGLPHRLEYVTTINGVEFINDSISTIPLATINAVKAFDKVDTLIIGGMDRGISYDLLVDFLNKSNIEHLIFLKDSGYRVADMLSCDSEIYRADNMEDAVNHAVIVTKTRCILSPAAASYGFYKNFEARGNHYKELLKKASEQ